MLSFVKNVETFNKSKSETKNFCQWKAFQAPNPIWHSKQSSLCKAQEKETNFGCKNIMMSARISMCGQTSIHLVEPKVWMNGVHFCTQVSKKFIPLQICKLCPSFIPQQDGARCQTSVYTLPYIPFRIPKLLEPEFWPPHSPNLNPLNYCLWGYVTTVLHNHQNVSDFDKLKKEIIKARKAIPQATINRAILTFKKRLWMCIKTNEGHIEHYPWV